MVLTQGFSPPGLNLLLRLGEMVVMGSWISRNIVIMN